MSHDVTWCHNNAKSICKPSYMASLFTNYAVSNAWNDKLDRLPASYLLTGLIREIRKLDLISINHDIINKWPKEMVNFVK